MPIETSPLRLMISAPGTIVATLASPAFVPWKRFALIAAVFAVKRLPFAFTLPCTFTPAAIAPPSGWIAPVFVMRPPCCRSHSR